MGRNDEAIADFGRALFFRPDLAEAHVARADAYFEKGRTIEALADYQKALSEKPEIRQTYPGIAAKMAMLAGAP
jgi:tetratricopeptide (TPR) repeat protein